MQEEMVCTATGPDQRFLLLDLDWLIISCMVQVGVLNERKGICIFFSMNAEFMFGEDA